VDFEVVKKQLTAPESMKELFAPDDARSDDDRKKLVITLVELLELGFLQQPLRRVIEVLCEHARHRVLATSVLRATASIGMEEVIRAAWLADIDSGRGAPVLKKVIKDLPAAPFVRITLATHFLLRVYWSHWKKEDRVVLLNAAEDLLKPLQLGFNKSKLIRLIDKKKSEAAPEESP
jgi:hypothetical protein